MKIKLKAAVLGLAIASSLVQAQDEPRTDQQETYGEGEVHNTLVPQPEGTALINAPANISLEQTAVNKPAELTGIAVTDEAGRTIGEVDRIVRRISDNVLHAVVRKPDGPLTATVLNELKVRAFAFWNPANALPATAYEPADYEVVDQYQAGHSAYGSLSDPDGESVRRQTYSRQAGQADRQVAADAAVQQNAEPAVAAAIPSGQSSITQMALTQADLMKGIPLMSASGERLGVIAQILRNTGDGVLYALVNTEAEPSVVSLEALKVGQLMFSADGTEPQDQVFDEINFRQVQAR